MPLQQLAAQLVYLGDGKPVSRNVGRGIGGNRACRWARNEPSCGRSSKHVVLLLKRTSLLEEHGAALLELENEFRDQVDIQLLSLSKTAWPHSSDQNTQ